MAGLRELLSDSVFFRPSSRATSATYARVAAFLTCAVTRAVIPVQDSVHCQWVDGLGPAHCGLIHGALTLGAFNVYNLGTVAK